MPKLKPIVTTLILAIVAFAMVAIHPMQASAACKTSGDNTSYCLLAPLPSIGDGSGLVNVSTGFGDYLTGIIKLVMGLIGVFAVLMVIIGGIEYMSTVNVGEKEGAKSRILNAIFGLVLALASYLILNTINPKLVGGSISIGSSSSSASTSP